MHGRKIESVTPSRLTVVEGDGGVDFAEVVAHCERVRVEHLWKDFGNVQLQLLLVHSFLRFDSNMKFIDSLRSEQHALTPSLTWNS